MNTSLDAFLGFFLEIADHNPLVITSFISVCITSVGAIIAVLSIRSSRVLARNKNAVDFEKSLESSASYAANIAELTSFKRSTASDPVAILALAQDASIDRDAHAAAINILNWWERAGNGIACGVYENQVLRKAYCSHLVNLGEYLMPFVRVRRAEGGNRHLFIQFERLLGKWKFSRSVEDFFDMTRRWLFKLIRVFLGVFILFCILGFLCVQQCS